MNRRLTITLSEARRRALKDAAATRAKTIGPLIDESREFYGIKTRGDASVLVESTRLRCGLDEAQATALAEREVSAVRRRG
jgi:hypothetical protein